MNPPGPIKFSGNNERQTRAPLSRAEATAQMTTIKENRSHLGVNQPAVVERDVEQIEHDAFWRVLEDSHAGELHIHVQTCLQLVQHRHGVAHVLGNKEEKTGSLVNLRRYIEPYKLLPYSWLPCTRQQGLQLSDIDFSTSTRSS